MKNFKRFIALMLAIVSASGTLSSRMPVVAAATEVSQAAEDDADLLTKVDWKEEEEVEFGSSYSLEAVIGKDDRKKIADTTEFPYSAISHMYMVYSCGCKGFGTGFMISDNTMLTAGHCVICETHKQKISSLVCKFGYSYTPGTKNKEGKEDYIVKVSGCKTFYYDSDYLYGTYSGIQEEYSDYAFVVFKNNIGQVTGHFGIKAFTDSELDGKTFTVGGYCRDEDPLTIAQGKVSAGYTNNNIYGGEEFIEDKYLLSYKTDTIPGNSGGPLFDKNNMIAGIHVAGVPNRFNLARRVTSGMMNSLVECGLIDNATKVKPQKRSEILYKDVRDPSKFWYEPTYYLTSKNVVKGYDNQTKFKPGNKCTRAQMVAFLWRLNGSPAPKSKTCKFSDVMKGTYYYKAVIWAVENGITTGLSKKKFGPAGVCTRAQTVTFLWRMAGKPEPANTKNKFKDVKKSDYFYKAVLWASDNKIVAGYKDGTFKPSGKCLRRQMVTFLYKYDKAVNNKAKPTATPTATPKPTTVPGS